MLVMQVRGKVAKFPESKVSAKGVAYARVVVKTPPTSRKQDWGKSVYLTAFGNMVGQVEMLQVGAEVEVVCEPGARGWLDKQNKVAAMLEGVIKTLKVLSDPQPIAEMQPSFEESDIPF